jgi:TorA maturation chaperone TorD
MENSARSQVSGNPGENNVLPGIFRFLALSLSYPAPDWLNNDYCTALHSMLKGLGWHGDIRELDDLMQEDPDIIETLQVEHTRLFINAVPHVIAPPYGSVYMRGEGTIMNKSTERVREFYRQQGFDLAPGKEIADHLVYELEFLGLLAESGDPAEEGLFLQRFFRPWFEKFRDRVIEGADHHFYRVQVRLIDFFTKEE